MQNKNRDSAAFGKYFATAVYDKKFVETDELASFIQQQASVKKSDIGAVLDELGEAMKHYFELGQKVRIKGLGISPASESPRQRMSAPRPSPTAACCSSPRPSASSWVRRRRTAR